MRRVAGRWLAVALVASMCVPMAARSQEKDFAAERRRMVEEQIRRRGIERPDVLAAMEAVPRHLFVPESVRDQAYEDHPLPIGEGQTITQPYVVALMTSLLNLDKNDKVLEIGTGSGYQAAVLSRLAKAVYTIEIRAPLAHHAEQTLKRLGYDSVHVRIGDGYQGWPEAAPFDGIVVTAAPDRIPQPLVKQLKLGGRMVIPVGKFFQDLMVLTKTEKGLERRTVIPVRFVPMTGEIENK